MGVIILKITDVEVYCLSVPMDKKISAPISIPYSDELAGTLFKEYRSNIIKITTDEGYVGVGESMTRLAPKAYANIINYIKELLIGKNPLNTEKIWELLYGVVMNRGHQKGFYIEALSGIDVALWDIKGKAFDVPVYVLLGGKTNPKLDSYAASLRFRDKETLMNDVNNFLEKGFNAMKIKIGQDPKDYSKDIRVCKEIRKAVGDDISLMVDANCGYDNDIKTALQVGKALEEIDIFWYEEPLSPDNLKGNAFLREKLNTRLAIGEAEFTRFGYREMFEKKALDVVMTNICRMGGLTEAKKVADMASTYHIPYSPHCGSSSAVTTAVSLQLAVAHPNHLIFEFMQSDWNKSQKNPLYWEITELPIKSFENGFIEIDDKPGIGVNLDYDLLDKYRIM